MQAKKKQNITNRILIELILLFSNSRIELHPSVSAKFNLIRILEFVKISINQQKQCVQSTSMSKFCFTQHIVKIIIIIKINAHSSLNSTQFWFVTIVKTKNIHSNERMRHIYEGRFFFFLYLSQIICEVEKYESLKHMSNPIEA